MLYRELYSLYRKINLSVYHKDLVYFTNASPKHSMGLTKSLYLLTFVNFPQVSRDKKMAQCYLISPKKSQDPMIDCQRAFSRKIQASIGLLILILVQFAFCYARVFDQ